MPADPDVVVIGAGQAGLAVGYQLQRLGRRGGRAPSVVLLDDHPAPGGAWQDLWSTLRLFSPAAISSLPGWPMPPWRGEGEPDAAHVTAYLAAYEQRYALPAERPVRVTAVRSAGERLSVEADDGRRWSARWVVSATGSWRRPFWPRFPGMELFAGAQLHTADYAGAQPWRGRRVLVVGGGNSGAQIAADLVLAGVDAVWATRRPPRLLPDDVDGRVLFATATRAVEARVAGRRDEGVGGLGDVVAVPSVRQARDELGLTARPMPRALTREGVRWEEGEEAFDAVIWCTGFRPALRHLHPLGLAQHGGHPRTRPTLPGGAAVVAEGEPRLLLVGYGEWSGPASATLLGVNRSARAVADHVAAGLAAEG